MLSLVKTMLMSTNDNEPRLERCSVCGALLPWHEICEDADFCPHYWDEDEEDSSEQ